MAIARRRSRKESGLVYPAAKLQSARSEASKAGAWDARVGTNERFEPIRSESRNGLSVHDVRAEPVRWH